MVSVIHVKPLADQRLSIRFDDGSCGEVNLRPLLPDAPLTRPLRDPAFFEQVQIYPGGDGIFWPNDFDLAADMLYEVARGEFV
jgi:hypothetical protein